MERSQIEHLIDRLNHKKVEVKFTKKNGEQRQMTCTKHLQLIPEEFHPNGKGTKKENEEVAKVFDLEKQAWRSFRFDSVTFWSIYG